MGKYKYKAAGLTDPGTVKSINEDSFYLKMGAFNREYFIFAIVADGMGGTEEGELASKSLTAAFANWYHKDLKDILEICQKQGASIEESLARDWEEIITEVTLELNSYSKAKEYEEGKGPGSTVAGLFIYNGEYYIVNCGDSRVYKQSDELKQITVDHSWAQMARDNGVSEEDIEKDRRSNKVTRCIGCGITGIAEGEYFSGEYEPGDRFLLCSDGLRRVLDSDTLEEILNDEELNTKEKCLTAVGLAKARGETDNITAVIIETAENDDKENHIRVGVAESTYIESKGNVTEELHVQV